MGRSSAPIALPTPARPYCERDALAFRIARERFAFALEATGTDSRILVGTAVNVDSIRWSRVVPGMQEVNRMRCLNLVLGLFVGLIVSLGNGNAANDQAIEDALRGTFRLTKGSASGTAFLVSLENRDNAKGKKHVLVTAAHVFDDLKGTDCTLVMRGPGKDGIIVRKEITLTIRDGKKPLWVKHPDVHVAALGVDLPDGVDFKAFRLDQIADEKWATERKVRVGRDVCIPCFPAQVEANEAGWPILRKGSIATHPLTPLASAKTMFVDYSHFGGDSGAPVVLHGEKEPIVVGLVIAMQRQTDKSTTPFEERTVHTPLGLAIAVQSPFILQTIEMLQKK